MTETSIAEAKNQLTRLIYQAECGQAVHMTRCGRAVAVLLSEAEYARLSRGSARPLRYPQKSEPRGQSASSAPWSLATH